MRVETMVPFYYYADQYFVINFIFALFYILWYSKVVENRFVIVNNIKQECATQITH